MSEFVGRLRSSASGFSLAVLVWTQLDSAGLGYLPVLERCSRLQDASWIYVHTICLHNLLELAATNDWWVTGESEAKPKS